MTAKHQTDEKTPKRAPPVVNDVKPSRIRARGVSGCQQSTGEKALVTDRQSVPVGRLGASQTLQRERERLREGGVFSQTVEFALDSARFRTVRVLGAGRSGVSRMRSFRLTQQGGVDPFGLV